MQRDRRAKKNGAQRADDQSQFPLTLQASCDILKWLEGANYMAAPYIYVQKLAIANIFLLSHFRTGR